MEQFSFFGRFLQRKVPVVFAAVAASVVGSSVGNLASEADAQSATITFSTTPNGGNYAPRNVVSVWAVRSDGVFQKTLGRWSVARTQHLVAWNEDSGFDTDAVSGATRVNHNDALTLTWDFVNKDGIQLAEAVYTIRFESADQNSTAAGQNNQGTIELDHDGITGTRTAPDSGGFTNITIDYVAAPPRPDAGPGGGGGGGGDNCSDGDGMCPSGCTTDNDNDNDCSSGAGGANVEGGCSVSSSSPGPFTVLLGVVALVLGFRRRR